MCPNEAPEYPVTCNRSSMTMPNRVLVYVVWSTIALSTGGSLFNGVLAVLVDVK